MCKVKGYQRCRLLQSAHVFQTAASAALPHTRDTVREAPAHRRGDQHVQNRVGYFTFKEYV